MAVKTEPKRSHDAMFIGGTGGIADRRRSAQRAGRTAGMDQGLGYTQRYRLAGVASGARINLRVCAIV